MEPKPISLSREDLAKILGEEHQEVQDSIATIKRTGAWWARMIGDGRPLRARISQKKAALEQTESIASRFGISLGEENS